MLIFSGFLIITSSVNGGVAKQEKAEYKLDVYYARVKVVLKATFYL